MFKDKKQTTQGLFYSTKRKISSSENIFNVCEVHCQKI
jgi:hypothetical protein